VLRRSGTTWRTLPEVQRVAVADAASARALLLAHLSPIRHLLVEWPDCGFGIGFDEAAWAAPWGGG
jgi:hypothetical protein